MNVSIKPYNPKFWAEQVIGWNTDKQIKQAKVSFPESLIVRPNLTKSNFLCFESVHNTVLQGRGRESALHRAIIEVNGKQYDVVHHPIMFFGVNDQSDEQYCKSKFISLPDWVVHPERFAKAKELRDSNPILANMSVMDVFTMMQEGKLTV